MPHVSGIIQYLPFCDWLISFSIMSSRFIHIVASARISIFFFSFFLVQLGKKKIGASYLLGFHVIRSYASGHARWICYKKHWFDYFSALPSLWASHAKLLFARTALITSRGILSLSGIWYPEWEREFFLRLNSIPVCIYHILFTHSFVDSLLSCFHHLTIRSNAWALLLLSASSMIKWQQYNKCCWGRGKTKPIAGEDAKWYNHFQKQCGSS